MRHFKYIIYLFLLIPFAACAQNQAESNAPLQETCDTTAKSTESSTLSLLFAGDMMQHTAQIEMAARKGENGTYYSYDSCFMFIKPIVKQADLAICNFEVTLGGKPYKGYPCFSAPDEFLTSITDCGFDIHLTANNHCLDKGKAGLERTITQMQKAGLTQLGTYLDSADRDSRYPIIIEKNNIRLALLNFTYGTNGNKVQEPNIVNYIDTTEILGDIEKAKAKGAECIIACAHWGIEYVFTQNKQQTDLAHWLIENGVDHVIGGHPHCLEPEEFYMTSDSVEHYIIYSQGNLISNMSKFGTTGGVLLQFTLTKNNDGNGNQISFTRNLIPYYVTRPQTCRDFGNNYVVVPATDGLTPVCNLSPSPLTRFNDFMKHAKTVIPSIVK